MHDPPPAEIIFDPHGLDRYGWGLFEMVAVWLWCRRGRHEWEPWDGGRWCTRCLLVEDQP